MAVREKKRSQMQNPISVTNKAPRIGHNGQFLTINEAIQELHDFSSEDEDDILFDNNINILVIPTEVDVLSDDEDLNDEEIHNNHTNAQAVVYDDYFDPIAPRYRPVRINALCRLTAFSKSEIKLMYQGFKQVCPTGVVNESTFKDIFNSYFPQGDASLYAHYVFKTCDKQNNGTINFQEFLTGLSLMTRGATIDKLKWTFNLYDINGDGRISQDEMREIIKSIYLMLGRYTEPQVNENTSVQHADKVFRRLDLNQDGYVTFDEFLETCQKDENIISSLQLLDTVL